MKYSDAQRIEKIHETAGKLLAYVERRGITRSDILEDETLQWTLTTPLYNIGEQAYYLSDAYKQAHGDIPWAKISGLRHRLVHSYYETNWEIIASVVLEVLPAFYRDVHALIGE